ncbi:MAG: DUF4157 domain-containing protein [Anaerolineales bacterium]|nr:DUF4157 domain-containing protein [Anaerolineales bacterium]
MSQQAATQTHEAVSAPAKQATRSQGLATRPFALAAPLFLTPENDRYEQEADRAAAAFSRGQGTAVSPAPVAEVQGTAVDPAVAAAIRQRAGKGERLPTAVRAPYEKALGHDFSQVSIHRDAAAHKLNASLDTAAFTHGQNIFLAQESGQLTSPANHSLLAHELTHVVQQSPGTSLVQAASKNWAKSLQSKKARVAGGALLATGSIFTGLAMTGAIGGQAGKDNAEGIGMAGLGGLSLLGMGAAYLANKYGEASVPKEIKANLDEVKTAVEVIQENAGDEDEQRTVDTKVGILTTQAKSLEANWKAFRQQRTRNIAQPNTLAG